MSYYPRDDWTLRYEQSNEGELYREKERLQQELEDTQARQRREDYTREQDDYRAQEQRRAEREELLENQMYHHDLLHAKDDDIEHLKLCSKFGIQEVEEP